MINDETFRKQITYLYMTIAVLIGIIAINYKICLRKIDKIEKEKEKIQQELIEYKWQLEQIPYLNWKTEVGDDNS